MQVDQPSLGLPRGIMVEPESNVKLHAAYERLIADTLLLLLPRTAGEQPALNETLRTAAGQAAAEIRRFEVQLARVRGVEQ